MTKFWGLIFLLFSFIGSIMAVIIPHDYPIHRRQNDGVNPLTTYIDYTDCNTTQRDIIDQATRDAITLAEAALEDDTELAAREHYHKTIDFSQRAALDYFGDNVLNAGQQEKILTTFYRSSIASPTWGWDWWQNRYISYSCKDFYGPQLGGCDTSTTAYTDNSKGNNPDYPVVVFCPAFFDALQSHSDRVAAIRADTTGQMKLNLRNLRSRATTTLHEWLHVTNIHKAWTCNGGCRDTIQYIGSPGNRERIKTYKTGRAKLLATKSVSAAANTNDNYAYFAMARWMEKNLGTYPEFPHTWDDSKSKKENENNEDSEPGAPAGLQNWELEDAEFRLENGETGVTNAPMSLTTHAAIPVPTQGFQVSGSDDISCETTDGSPNLTDCLSAFANLNIVLDAAPVKHRNGDTWWAAYGGSCTIAVQYKADWGDSCGATMGDIRAHANAIVQMCGDGVRDKVGGRIPFAVENCPADIALFKANGSPPN